MGQDTKQEAKNLHHYSTRQKMNDAFFLMTFVEVIIGLHISRFWKRVLNNVYSMLDKKKCLNI
jgi:uncharacterized membrane protein YwzB